ncbi:MAG: DUF1573 domain-containing protein [bacterium]|nr:DUF1573 domain-containing protein [bacterium]
MKKRTGIIAVVVAIVIFVLISMNSVANPGADIIWPSGTVSSENSLQHDWGDINIKGGDVEKEFVFTNDSMESLVIKTAETSCACTSAFISVPGQNSARQFSMHNNPENWDAMIPAGEDFTVNVVFDPMAHGPTATGPIDRSIFIHTSAVADDKISQDESGSSDGSVIEIEVKGEVFSEEAFLSRQQSQVVRNTSDEVKEDFEFAEIEYDFGVLQQSQGLVTHDFPFTYNGEETISITGVPTSCACTTAEIDNETLNTGDTGIVTVAFDPNLHEEPDGRFFKTVSILTDPAMEEEPELKIWVEIDLDLGVEAYKLKEYED